MKISVVIPVFNEADSLTELHQRLVKVFAGSTDQAEFVFVNDGSTDTSSQILRQLHPVKVVELRKNFGQTAALDAGFKAATGEIIVSMDADLQNPPEEIPKLLNEMNKGWDVVSGWRTERHDHTLKRFTSKGAYWLRQLILHDRIHDSGCTLKAYRKTCFDDLDLFGELHRFIPAILMWQGFRVTEVPVKHAQRKHGASHYTWRRILRSLVDMLGIWFWRKYVNRPLHLFGVSGILLFLSGIGLGVALAILRLMHLISLQNTIWPLVSLFLMLAGIQLFVSGLLADILVKQYFSRGRVPYSVRTTWEQ